MGDPGKIVPAVHLAHILQVTLIDMQGDAHYWVTPWPSRRISGDESEANKGIQGMVPHSGPPRPFSAVPCGHEDWKG